MENWRALYDEVRAMREACGDAHIKTILATASSAPFGPWPGEPGLHDGRGRPSSRPRPARRA
jgi:hypothetical protein